MAAPFDMSALSNILNVRAARVTETASTLRHTSLDLACLQTLQPATFQSSLKAQGPLFADCLCALQDPSIKQMAEQIAQDPAFAQMAQAMQGGGGMPPGKLHADMSWTGCVTPSPLLAGCPRILDNKLFLIDVVYCVMLLLL